MTPAKATWVFRAKLSKYYGSPLEDYFPIPTGMKEAPGSPYSPYLEAKLVKYPSFGIGMSCVRTNPMSGTNIVKICMISIINI